MREAAWQTTNFESILPVFRMDTTKRTSLDGTNTHDGNNNQRHPQQGYEDRQQYPMQHLALRSQILNLN
jgi:hypothetical protein